MQIGTSKAAFNKLNKVGIVNNKEAGPEKKDVPDFSGKSSPEITTETTENENENGSDVEEEAKE